MINKVITSGQNEIEIAALDVAIRLNIVHGGFCSHGRQMVDGGAIPGHYHLKEIDPQYQGDLLEENMKTAQGVWVVGFKTPDEALNNIKNKTKELGIPLYLSDIKEGIGIERAGLVYEYIRDNAIADLMVIGCFENGSEINSKLAGDFIEAVILYCFSKTGTDPYHRTCPTNTDPESQGLPKTVDDAVKALVEGLPLKDKIVLANMAAGEVLFLTEPLMAFIQSEFFYLSRNSLLEDCRKNAGDEAMDEDSAVRFIITRLWEYLKETHLIRVVQ